MSGSAGRHLDRLLVLYVHLWVVEGAVRKWLPGMETVFYVLRDVFALVLIVALLLSPAVSRRRTGLLWAVAIACGLLVTVQVIGALVDLPVAVLGLRSYLAPLAFLGLLWAYGTGETAGRIGRAVTLWVPVQLVVSVLQVASAPTSWINREVGADAAHFVNDGIVRTSGTFSAPIGLTLFLALAAAAVLCRRRLPLVVRLALLLAVVVTAGISGARGTLLGVSLVIAAYLWQRAAVGGTVAIRSATGLVVTAAVSAVVVRALFPAVVESFLSRFEDAARSEDTLGRVIGQTFGFLTEPVTLAGAGAGAHSQAGIAAGSASVWIESDSVRWVAELGLLGLLLASARLLLGLWLVALVLFRARRAPLDVVLFAAALAPVLLYGSVSQMPTSQGFAGIAGGVVAVLLSEHRARNAPGPQERVGRSTRAVSVARGGGVA